jgi:hypothetical protein
VAELPLCRSDRPAHATVADLATLQGGCQTRFEEASASVRPERPAGRMVAWWAPGLRWNVIARVNCSSLSAIGGMADSAKPAL